MSSTTTRRTFLKQAVAAASVCGAVGALPQSTASAAEATGFDISIAAWSLHRSIGNDADRIPMLEMPRLAREEFEIGAIELVNRMLASDQKAYIDRFIKNAQDHDIKILLIMVDGEGSVGAQHASDREDAVKRHSHWIDIAADMGCHSIRMNWAGAPRGVMENDSMLQDFIDRSVRPFRELCAYGDSKNINVIIENHGGPSSYPHAMERLIQAVDSERFGTLPDFGNFPRNDAGDYIFDIYEAIDRLMPYAKAVSAKCYDFDDETGMETKLDYPRLLDIVVNKHNYHGYIGIEYEGNRLTEFEGIKACKRLLEQLRG